MVSIQEEVDCLTINEKAILLTNDISIIEDSNNQYGIKIKVKDVTIKIAVYPECDSEFSCFNTELEVNKEKGAVKNGKN